MCVIYPLHLCYAFLLHSSGSVNSCIMSQLPYTLKLIECYLESKMISMYKCRKNNIVK